MASGGKPSGLRQRHKKCRNTGVERDFQNLALDTYEDYGRQLQEAECNQLVIEHDDENQFVVESVHREPTYVRKDKTLAKSLQEDERKRALSADRRLAQEVADQELAYGLQLEIDREIAEDMDKHKSKSARQCQPHESDDYADRPSARQRGRQDGSQERQQAREDHGLFLPWLAPSGTGSVHESDGASGGSSASNFGMLFNLFPPVAERLRSTFTDEQWQTAQNDPVSFLMNAGASLVLSFLTENFTGDDYEALWNLAERLGEGKDRGMKQEDIESLPTSTVDRSRGESNDDDECKICYSEFTRGETIRTLPCCHRYHVACIDEWIRQNATCPICRMNVKEEVAAR